MEVDLEEVEVAEVDGEHVLLGGLVAALVGAQLALVPAVLVQ